MNCEQLKQAFGLRCTHISDDVSYLETGLSLPHYGTMVGGYVQDIGRGRIRISDNADTLFEAMTLGVKPSHKRAKTIDKLASQFGVQISDAGEICVYCDEADAAYFFSRYIEAAYTIGSATLEWHPEVATEFERHIASILCGRLKKRVKRGFQVHGASGHQLRFHFAIDPGEPGMSLVQTISTQENGPNWTSVYSTSGKMIDVKNASPDIRRIVVLEPSASIELQRARTVLAETAKVVVFEGPDQLLRQFAA